MPSRRWAQLGVVLYNFSLTHVPSHTVRIGALRLWGARIGSNVAIGRGTQVLDIHSLAIGDDCSIGFRCMLDARGGITIEHDVVLASDTHIITGQHDPHADDFAAVFAPVHVGHHAWLASRVTVVMGVRIGIGAVVGACSLVREDVPDMQIVAGVPAKPRGARRSALTYTARYRRLFF